MARNKISRQSLRMKKKLFVVFVLVIAVFVFLVGRLAYIELKSGDRYEKIVLSQQNDRNTTIPFRRGDIVDRKGTVLATSTDVYNVILDCSVITSRAEYLEPTLEALKSCFSMNTEEIRTYIKENPDKRYYVLAKKLPYDSVAKFEELAGDKKNHPNIKGIWFEKEYQRTYPYPELLSSVLGFTTSGNEGIGGIEAKYNETLNGIDGRSYGYMNADSNYETTVRDAVNGQTVVTTIDANIQQIVQDKIADFAEEYSKDKNKNDAAKHIGVIAMDPDTGEILAMANYPSFSLDDPWNLDGYYTKSEQNAMGEKEKLKALNAIWQNFCTTYTYEPGSTMKPITVAAALDTGTLNGSESFYCGGQLQVSDRVIHCDNRGGHGSQTVAEAIQNSCNVSLMQIGFKLGAKDFAKYQRIFNIGLKTNIDLPGEARTDTLVFKEEDLKKINLATSSFGQSFNVTMIQTVCAYASIVNGGYYYQPHVVRELKDEKGNSVKTIEPALLRHTISESTSDTMISYLKRVTESGTARAAKIEGYSMAGKTGTAEKIPRGQGNYLVSFISSVPAEDPQIVLYVVVDEPNSEDQAHSTYAQGIAKSIYEEVLPYLNIERDEAASADGE